MSAVRFIFIAALFIALLFVSLDNAELVTLRFFRLYSIEAPLIFVVLCAFTLGAALGLIAGALRTAQVRRELRRVRRSATVQSSRGDRHDDVPATPPLDAV